MTTYIVNGDFPVRAVDADDGVGRPVRDRKKRKAKAKAGERSAAPRRHTNG